MIEKTKTSVGEMAAEKKAAAAAMLEAQAKKTGDVLWQSKSNLESTVVDAATEGKQSAIDGFDKEVEKVDTAVDEGIQEVIMFTFAILKKKKILFSIFRSSLVLL